MNLDPYRNEIPPRREVLPGGAVLLSTPMRTAHAVTFGVWLRTGSQDEPAGLGGVSHFLEHIVFKGTRSKSAFEVASTFDSIGAAVDAFTTKDMVAFTVKVLPEYFEPAVELLAEMLLEPAFDPRLVRSWNRTWSSRRSRRRSTRPRTACTTPSRPGSTAATPAAVRSWVRR